MWFSQSFVLALALVPGSLSLPSFSKRAELSTCLQDKNVPILLASSPDYAQAALPFNVRLDYKPAVIVVPQTQQHVSDAVVCAGQYGVKVQARGGGHSYAAFGLGGQDGSMVIDLQTFQDVTLDTSTQIASVGGGVRLGNMALGIYNQGGAGLPHGTCPGVGVGGHATHGGFGYSSRNFGLTLDRIVALDVVLANGSYVTATANDYPDLYYALRGAGESFGVILTFHMQTFTAPSLVLASYDLSDVLGSKESAAAAFIQIQAASLNSSITDRRLSLGMYTDGNAFSLTVGFNGDQADYSSRIEQALVGGLSVRSANVRTLGWLDALTALGAPDPLQQPTTGYNAHVNFFAKSVVSPESDPFTLDAMEQYYDFIITQKSSSGNPWFSIINLYGGPDSQINAVGTDFSSYAHRDSLWVFQHYGNTPSPSDPFPDTIIPFIDDLNAAIINAQPDTDFLAYSNYVDPTLSAQEAHELYYGDDVYNRLVGIKSIYDPDMVFSNPQAIGV